MRTFGFVNHDVKHHGCRGMLGNKLLGQRTAGLPAGTCHILQDVLTARQH